jgi:hypothetical protein
MKKTNKVNPLTHFNNTKTAAYKKASKEMANYKKSLPKAQEGFIGPKTEWESFLSNQPPIPRPNRPSMSSIKKYNPWAASIELKTPRPVFLDLTDPGKGKKLDQNAIDAFNEKYPNGIPGPSVIKQKKGGPVKRKNK